MNMMFYGHNKPSVSKELTFTVSPEGIQERVGTTAYIATYSVEVENIASEDVIIPLTIFNKYGGESTIETTITILAGTKTAEGVLSAADGEASGFFIMCVLTLSPPTDYYCDEPVINFVIGPSVL